MLGPEGAVAGLTKADDPLFEPCWIESPLPEWEPRAREAWSIVLGDTDSRLLYGRIRFLSNLLDSLGKTFHAIPVDEIDRYFRDRIVRAGEEELLALCCEYFPGAAQRITNTGTGDLVFLCICTPAFEPDCYEDLEEKTPEGD